MVNETGWEPDGDSPFVREVNGILRKLKEREKLNKRGADFNEQADYYCSERKGILAEMKNIDKGVKNETGENKKKTQKN